MGVVEEKPLPRDLIGLAAEKAIVAETIALIELRKKLALCERTPAEVLSVREIGQLTKLRDVAMWLQYASPPAVTAVSTEGWLDKLDGEELLDLKRLRDAAAKR